MKLTLPIFLSFTVAAMAAAATAPAPTAPLTFPQPSAKPPFTVAKDTTILTAPLNADGTVDYLQALNTRYAANLRADDNGYRLWITLLSDHDARLPGIDQIARMAGADPSEPRHPWPVYQDFLGTRFGNAWEARYRAMQAATKRPWQPAEVPELAEFLDTGKPLFDIAAAAARKPRWWVPTYSPSATLATAVDSSDSTTRELALLLCARATRRAAAGDMDGFLADMQTVKLLARKLAIGTPLNTFYTALGIDLLADQSLAAIVSRGALSEAQCRAVGQALAALPAIEAAHDLVDISLRWTALDAASVIATGRAHQLTFPDGRVNFFDSIDPGAVDWDPVLRHLNRSADDALRTMAIENRPDRLAAIDARNKPLTAITFSAGFLKQQPGEARGHYTERVAAALEAFFLTDAEHPGEIQRRNHVSNLLAQTALAAAAFKAHTGRWPQQLSDLVPQFLPEIPRDINNTPFTLATTKQGITFIGIPDRQRPLILGAPDP
ncbi:MAG TPA: hypothetical protein VH253_19305 [Phycisphaerae bacterium]|nr:hypothetical protein [Phycisphaerae bacterium]